MAESKIPAEVKLLVCKTCGRTDRHALLRETGFHFSGGTRCAGTAEWYVYRLVEGENE